MQIFVVNLKKDKKRKQYIQNISKKIGIKPTFIEAINGKEFPNIDKYLFPEKTIKTIGRLLGKSEIGCILSHQSIYKQILCKKIPYALILEDDIYINKQIKKILNSLEKNIKKKTFDTILLGYHGIYSRTDLKLKSKVEKNIYTNFNIIKLKEKAYGTYGYIISLNGAKKILQQSSQYHSPIDWSTGNSIRNNVYAIYPQPILINEPLSDDSSIMEERQLMAKERKEYLKKKHIQQTINILSIKTQHIQSKRIVLYGYNDIAENFYKKFKDRVIDIIDTFKAGTKINKNLTIKNLNSFKLDNVILVITVVNKENIFLILENIKKSGKNFEEIISLIDD